MIERMSDERIAELLTDWTHEHLQHRLDTEPTLDNNDLLEEAISSLLPELHGALQAERAEVERLRDEVGQRKADQIHLAGEVHRITNACDEARATAAARLDLIRALCELARERGAPEAVIAALVTQHAEAKTDG